MFKNLRLFFIALLCVSTPILAISAAAPGAPPPQSAPITANAAQIAELTRKADEARYAKDIAEIRADILQSQTNWFEILTSTMIGLFGVLITVAVLFVTLRSEKLAIAEAKIAAVGSLAAEREAINAQLEAAKDAVAEINSHRETVRELTKDLAAGEAPSDPEKVRKISELAEDAQKKSRKDRTVDDYRALVIESLIQKDWPAMERRASAMAYLFDGEAGDESIAFALVQKAYALGQLARHEHAIAANDEVVARFGSSVATALQEIVAMALANKGASLGALTRHEDAIAANDEVVARFGSSAAPGLQEQVANALFNKACALAMLENVAACIETLTLWGEKRGGIDCDAIRNDDEFDKVRERPAFKAFLAKHGCG